MIKDLISGNGWKSGEGEKEEINLNSLYRSSEIDLICSMSDGRKVLLIFHTIL
jgi:hypothetical protein